MAKEDKLLFTTNDPRGYTISLSNDQYVNHIISSEGHTPHNEFTPDEIKDCIEKPAMICQSASISTTDLYFAKTSARYPALFLETVVDVNDERKTGDVVTAYLKKNPTGGKDGGLKYVNFKSKL